MGPLVMGHFVMGHFVMGRFVCESCMKYEILRGSTDVLLFELFLVDSASKN
jgi:hypothetical protein